MELGTEMAISLLHFTTFFQGEDKSIERGENHYKSGHVESFSYVPALCAISVPSSKCGCGDVYHMRREQRKAVHWKKPSVEPIKKNMGNGSHLYYIT